MVIYKIVNKVNNKFYIGQTKNDPKRRWQDHCSVARRGSLAPIHQAIRKYGEHNFDLIILRACVSHDDMNNAEIELIKSLKPTYNIHHGGSKSFNEEHGKRVREAMANPEVMAKVHSVRDDPVINAKLRKALKERVHSNKEAVAKMIAGGMKRATPILATNIETGEVTRFDGLRPASRALKLHDRSIRKVLNGEMHQTGGFTFKYADRQPHNL